MGGSCCVTSDAAESGPGGDVVQGDRLYPSCGSRGATVGRQTVAALTRGRLTPIQSFRTCRTPDCENVYYGDRGACLGVGDLYVVPGFKTTGPEGLVCYCFMHSRGEIERELLAGGGSHPMGESTVQRRITEQTKAGNCACEVRNPTGRCCLGDVTVVVEAVRDRFSDPAA